MDRNRQKTYEGAGRAAEKPPLGGFTVAGVVCLEKFWSQSTGKSRNPGNSVMVCTKKQASSEMFSPEWSPWMEAGRTTWVCYIQWQLPWRGRSIEIGRLSKKWQYRPCELSGDLAFYLHSKKLAVVRPLTFCRLAALPQTSTLLPEGRWRQFGFWFLHSTPSIFFSPSLQFLEGALSEAVVADRSVFKEGMCVCRCNRHICTSQFLVNWGFSSYLSEGKNRRRND